MADWPLPISGDFVGSGGFDLSVTDLTLLNSTTNTYSAWVEAIASTVGPADSVLLHGFAQATMQVIDIGIGPAGSEEVIAEATPVTGVSGARTFPFVLLPLHIPEGSRVALRGKGDATANNAKAAVQLFNHGDAGRPGFQHIFSVGVQSDAHGVPSLGSAIANTKNAWVEIVASLAENWEQFWVSVVPLTGEQSSASFLIDVAVGSAGNEEVIASNCPLSTSTAETPVKPCLIPVSVAKGERIAVRHQSSTTITPGDRDLEIALFGAK